MTRSEPSFVRNVVVVGGGTSGWMTAALLSRHLTSPEQHITVIEPPGPRGIGVGEASVVSLHALLRALGADEARMMQRCEATYKLGIQFCDWTAQNHVNWHPFGLCGAPIDGRDLFPFWFAETKRSALSRPYHSYSLNWSASVAGKGPHAASGSSPIAETKAYGFHFNAQSLADWLREHAIGRNVSEAIGTVVNSELLPNGDVASVTLNTGERIDGQLFIDCSGFQSVLMHGALKDPFLSWNDRLLCDRAVACKLPGIRVVPPYTQSRAMPAGWMWRIPLAHHVGLGYVYSSDFLTDDQAWQQLRQLGAITDNSVVPRFLRMRVGRQTNFWNRNVVAIGLSAGFVEPLESTGLHLTQLGIERLMKLFPTSDYVRPLQHEYNSDMATVYDQVRDFIQLHYLLSRRDDTPFWLAARRTAASDQLKHRLALYDDAGALDSLRSDAFGESSYYHMLAGNGRFPRRASPLALATDAADLKWILQTMEAQNDNALRALPLHEELLNRLHRPTAARAS